MTNFPKLNQILKKHENKIQEIKEKIEIAEDKLRFNDGSGEITTEEEARILSHIDQLKAELMERQETHRHIKQFLDEVKG